MIATHLLPDKTVFAKQVWFLTGANLRTRYRNTWAGLIWVTLNPLILYGVQSLVFAKFLRLDVYDYPLFLAAGLLPWIFLAQSLDMGVPSFVNSGRLLKSFSVHPLVFLTAQLTDNLLNFLIGFALVLIPLLARTTHAGQAFSGAFALLFPLAILFLFIGTLSVTWILATAQVFFRDTRFLLTFALTTGFYLTPIFYPAEFVPTDLRWMVKWNPFYRLIDPFRSLFYPHATHSIGSALFISGCVASFFFITAVLLWRKSRNALYFHL